MPLRLTLKPDERIIVNGCVIRNASRRQTLTIENQANVVRGHDLLNEQEVSTPATRVYFLIQTVLVAPELRDDFVPQIQKNLAELATVFGPEYMEYIMNAANFVSMGDHYKALRALSKVIKHERTLLDMMQKNVMHQPETLPQTPKEAVKS